MRGDFSRDVAEYADAAGHDRVELQQGRVLLDADWNAQASIDAHRSRRIDIDVVGYCGAPRHAPGFRLTSDGNRSLIIGAGRAHVGGVEITNHTDVSLVDQPFAPFDPSVVLPGPGPLLAYLEVSERLVSVEEDPRLAEVALNGPDTTTRRQKAWRVALVPITEAQADSLETGGALDPPAWPASNGRLEAAATPPGDAPPNRPCLLPPEGGFAGRENRLYRVEVHQSGNEGSARFKISKDNGSVRAVISESGGKRRLVGERDSRSFPDGVRVEVQSPPDRLAATPGTLHLLRLAPDQTITFEPALAGIADGYGVTRWDHATGDASGIAIGTDWLDLDEGVRVRLHAGTYLAGEFWTIPARTATADVEWPLVPGDPPAARPQGPWTAHCPLHVVRVENGELAVGESLLTEFPPLTAIEARDVHYDSSRVDLGGADDVQEALEYLSGMAGGGTCTLHAAPGDDLQAIVDRIPGNSSISLCLSVGIYELASPLRISNMSHVVVRGAGPGTTLTVARGESVVRLLRCASVAVEDLAIRGARTIEHTTGRNGVLHVQDCGATRIERVDVRCRAASQSRESAGISVSSGPRSNASRRVRDVTVADCRVEVAVGQIGVQIINAHRSRIANNVIVEGDARSAWVWDYLVATQPTRAEIVDLLIANRRAPGRSRAGNRTDLRRLGYVDRELRLDDNRISIDVPANLGDALGSYLRSAGPAGIEDSDALGAHLRRVTGQALANRGVIRVRRRGGPPADFNLITGLVNRLRRGVRAHMRDGIVVAGRTADSVEIVGNDIGVALNGIRVALSHSAPSGASPDVVRRVVIVENRIRVTRTPLLTQPTGIHVVHPDSAVVRANTIRLIDAPLEVSAPARGIVVVGRFGPFCEVIDNDVRLGGPKSVGIEMRADPPLRFDAPAWVLDRNMVQGADDTYDTGPRVHRGTNFST